MLSLVLAALAAPAVVTLPPRPAPARCSSAITYAARPGLPARPQKLGELPPANQYLAVLRSVDGCPEPAIVRTGIRR